MFCSYHRKNIQRWFFYALFVETVREGHKEMEVRRDKSREEVRTEKEEE